MKYTPLAIALGALLVPGSATAELAANIGATSNYVWRGVTQTDDRAAISGGIDYAHDSGFYLGTWASNVDYGDDTTAEVDLYGGFANEVGALGYDFGVIYYGYPGGDDLDFTELYGSLSFGPATLGLAYTIDKEDGGAEDGDIYYHLSVSADIAPSWSIGGTVGYYDFEESDEYTHGQIDITRSAGDFGDFTLSVSVADDDDDLGIDGDPKVFVSWGKSF